MTETTTAPSLLLTPTDEETAIREAVGGICAKFGPRYGRNCYDNGQPPRELWRALAAAGFIATGIAEEYGGGGLGMRGQVIVIEEVAAHGASSLMLILSVAMAGTMLERHGTAAQRERWLTGIVDGSIKLGFAITESDAGSNSHELRTALSPHSDGTFRLSGQKTFISGIEDAEGILVIARTRAADGSLGQPTVVIVDVDAPGLSRDLIPMPYMGPEKQWTLFFDEVEIEPERIVGGLDAGLGVVFDALNPERISAAAMMCGTARLALERASTYANERQVWGVPIGSHQGVAHPLAKAKIELELSRLMTQKAAALFDAGSAEAGEASNMAKYAATEAANHALDAAIQAHGGNGLTIEYGLSDQWWLTRLLRIGPVSEQMVLNHVAQHALGLPRSY